MAIIPGKEKVFMVDKRTNTTYGGSQALQDMQQWYTMKDISDSVAAFAPYKVFTALLTQSGDDTQQDKVSGDTLDLGVTYLISVNSEDSDLTIFGAPNSNEGTYFICTNAGVLDPYKPLSLLYYTGTPVATVLENTIGNIWFTYDSEGSYTANSIGLFLLNKTTTSTSTSSDPGNPTWTTARIGNENAVSINSFYPNGDGANNSMVQMFFEIRVYN